MKKKQGPKLATPSATAPAKSDPPLPATLLQPKSKPKPFGVTSGKKKSPPATPSS